MFGPHSLENDNFGPRGFKFWKIVTLVLGLLKLSILILVITLEQLHFTPPTF
jgi:hypothetical protein